MSASESSTPELDLNQLVDQSCMTRDQFYKVLETITVTAPRLFGDISSLRKQVNDLTAVNFNLKRDYDHVMQSYERLIDDYAKAKHDLDVVLRNYDKVVGVSKSRRGVLKGIRDTITAEIGE